MQKEWQMKLSALQNLICELEPQNTIEVAINTSPLFFWNQDYIFSNLTDLCRLYEEILAGWQPSKSLTRQEALALDSGNLNNIYYKYFYYNKQETLNRLRNIKLYNYDYFDPNFVGDRTLLLVNVLENNEHKISVSI